MRYWLYVDGAVKGPYTVDQLIRVRGFSRHAQVCVDDGSGSAQQWTSASDIRELAHIFQAADRFHDAPAPAAPKPAPKPPRPAAPRRPAPTPAAAPEPAPAPPRSVWPWIVGALILIAGGAGGFTFYKKWVHEKARAQYATVTQFVLDYPLPAKSEFSSLRHYMGEKQLAPRWSVEKTPAELMNATLSWTASHANVPATVYTFEVNLAAQTMRGLNTAAKKLLSEGFARPQAPSEPPTSAPKKPKAPGFEEALGARKSAIEKGDFSSVWKTFSERRRSEMIRAGISESGFVRLQSLTRGLEASVKQEILKTKSEGDDRRLVLIKQTQDRKPDMFLKQSWVKEDGEWKLDDEEKKSSQASAPAEPTPQAESSSSAPAATSSENRESSNYKSRQAIMSLPGISTNPSH